MAQASIRIDGQNHALGTPAFTSHVELGSMDRTTRLIPACDNSPKFFLLLEVYDVFQSSIVTSFSVQSVAGRLESERVAPSTSGEGSPLLIFRYKNHLFDYDCVPLGRAGLKGKGYRGSLTRYGHNQPEIERFRKRLLRPGSEALVVALHSAQGK
ncbi:hypothetical protein VNO77_23143 [Canavalia gladiata]|uniref:Uncharacterized protein n=1 Tax=Canavalia gladiata TaxID=3824 RepID=A0AAN9QBM3_CANGL